MCGNPSDKALLAFHQLVQRVEIGSPAKAGYNFTSQPHLQAFLRAVDSADLGYEDTAERKADICTLFEAAETLFEPPARCQNKQLCASLAALQTEAECCCIKIQEMIGMQKSWQGISPGSITRPLEEKYPLQHIQLLLQAAVEAERRHLTAGDSAAQRPHASLLADEGSNASRQHSSSMQREPAADSTSQHMHASPIAAEHSPCMQQEPGAATKAGTVANTGGSAPGEQSFPMRQEPTAAAKGPSMALQEDIRAVQGASVQQGEGLVQSMHVDDDVMGADMPGALSDDDISIGGTPPPLPPPQVWAALLVTIAKREALFLGLCISLHTALLKR